MSLKSLVFAVVPSSESEKPASGEGDELNEKEVGPSGVASLMIVIEPGKNLILRRGLEFRFRLLS